MFKVAVGSSTNSDTAQAIGEIIAQCLARLAGQVPQAAIVFNNGHPGDSTVLTAIVDTWPEIALVGCGSDTDQARRLTLMLLYSPELEFTVGVGRQVKNNPGLAAEQALASTLSQDMERIALCLTLPESLHEWSNSFAEGVKKLLPPSTVYLNQLLPLPEGQEKQPISRQYHGRQVLTEAVPVLIALTRVDAGKREVPGWRFTREHGVLRKLCGEDVYEYDNLIGDRRRVAFGQHRVA